MSWSRTPTAAEMRPETVKLSPTPRAKRMEPSRSQMMRANNNRCLPVGGDQLYLGKQLRSTKVKVIWDFEELIVVSMEGGLIVKYDFPFPNGGYVFEPSPRE